MGCQNEKPPIPPVEGDQEHREEIHGGDEEGEAEDSSIGLTRRDKDDPMDLTGLDNERSADDMDGEEESSADSTNGDEESLRRLN